MSDTTHTVLRGQIRGREFEAERIPPDSPVDPPDPTLTATGPLDGIRDFLSSPFDFLDGVLDSARSFVLGLATGAVVTFVFL